MLCITYEQIGHILLHSNNFITQNALALSLQCLFFWMKDCEVKVWKFSFYANPLYRIWAHLICCLSVCPLGTGNFLVAKQPRSDN